eukprot:1540861-Rhodomonas_salina.1
MEGCHRRWQYVQPKRVSGGGRFRRYGTVTRSTGTAETQGSQEPTRVLRGSVKKTFRFATASARGPLVAPRACVALKDTNRNSSKALPHLVW